MTQPTTNHSSTAYRSFYPPPHLLILPSRHLNRERIATLINHQMNTNPGTVTINYSNGNVYEGSFQPHGIGKLKYADGRISNGIWKNGTIIYEGELADNGEPHGRGRWTYSNGFYEGEWKNGLRHGEGMYKWTDGSSYSGQWKDDKKHGVGVKKWPDGSSYDGEWRENKKHGKGTKRHANGDVWYTGDYRDGRPDGVGTLNYTNGDVYTGQWRANKKHGRGLMTYANEEIYEGEWRVGVRHGSGSFMLTNGDVITGEWINDKMPLDMY
mmetsp:Transcript_19379/g.33030  ORF Transcript_19379/g.33030 Transcript_19379/m.33030 type:complete len:268 (+) Transcript_19379:48-851(+)